MAFVHVPVKHHANPAGKKSNTPLSGVLRLMANHLFTWLYRGL
ncbi:hypothetical protein [Mangrovibacter plantisponsor]|nr:hypothetical protein [Mangrovibacter plantisponsor]